MAQSRVCAYPRQLSWRQGWQQGGEGAVRVSLRILTIAALAVAVTWTDGRLRRHLAASDDKVEFIYLPPTSFLLGVSLVYEHALADVLWFRTTSYFGKHYRSDRVYPWLTYMCDVVTDLDPSAEHVYRFAGLILPWEAERIDDGIALLEKGTRHLPGAWELHYMLGFSYYFFKDDLPAASRSLRTAMSLPDAPGFVTRLAAVVDAAHQGEGSAIDFLIELDRSNINSEMRDALRQRIRELTLSRDIDTLEAAVKSFQEAFGRLPADLGELISTGMVAAIPPEPFGGAYVLDAASAHVRSSLGHKPFRLGSSKTRDAILNGRCAHQ